MTKDPFDTLWINTKADREPFHCSSVIFPLLMTLCFFFFFTSLYDLVRFKNIMLEKVILAHTCAWVYVHTHTGTYTKAISSVAKCWTKLKNEICSWWGNTKVSQKMILLSTKKRKNLENNQTSRRVISINKYSLIKPDQFSYQVIPGYYQFSNSETC